MPGIGVALFTEVRTLTERLAAPLSAEDGTAPFCPAFFPLGEGLGVVPPPPAAED